MKNLRARLFTEIYIHKLGSNIEDRYIIKIYFKD